MRIIYGFDLLDVSALTTFNTGIVTAQLLSPNPIVWRMYCNTASGHTFHSCLADTGIVPVLTMLLIVSLRGYDNG